jgi:N,N'-diacetyllegionaminate synthase|tara:strand:- start:270 stop:1271 length:1002 start_codon:yes stop_codon:yes gene_type:complete
MNISKKIQIIAEIGVNHDGRISKAKKLVDVAKSCGADFAKFQVFSANTLATKKATLANYQKKNIKNKKINQKQLLEIYQLDKKDVIEIIKYCNKKKIKPLFSVFSPEDLTKVPKNYLKTIKVPSGEVTNVPLLRNISEISKKIILSTGMANIKEIRNAFKILKSKGAEVVLLHCTTNYPTKLNEANIYSVSLLKKIFKVKVGFSDHTETNLASILSVLQGSDYIEKHITLNRNSYGPDHSSSMEPKQFKNYVDDLRNIKIVLGKKIKKPTSSELKNLKIVRKSIFALRNIKKGELFSSTNLCCKRPGYGTSPLKWDLFIGKKAKKSYKKDDFI